MPSQIIRISKHYQIWILSGLQHVLFAILMSFTWGALAPTAAAQAPTLQGGRLTSGVPVRFTLGPVSETTLFGNWSISVPAGAALLKVELELTTPNVTLDLYTSRDPVGLRLLGGGFSEISTRCGNSARPSSGYAAIPLTPPTTSCAFPGDWYLAVIVYTRAVAANVTVTATVDPVPPVTSVSAATFVRGSALAAEAIASAFGQGLAGSTEAASVLPLPTSLAGTAVKVKDSAGVERLAPLFFVSPGQVNYLVPEGTRLGSATITVTSRERVVGAGSLPIDAVVPGLFTANASGRGVAAALALRVSADGAQTSQTAFRCGAAPGSCVPVPVDLGAESDQVFLQLFGTGIRGRSSVSAVRATIGGEAAEVVGAGPQGQFVGLDQVNVRLSRRLIGRGEVDVVLTVDGKAANTVTVSIGG